MSLLAVSELREFRDPQFGSFGVSDSGSLSLAQSQSLGRGAAAKVDRHDLLLAC